MKTVWMINGPNMNMLGVREPEHYGYQMLEDIEAECMEVATEIGLHLTCRQSNDESEIVTWIQSLVSSDVHGLLINGAAYSHTSIAIHDALKLLTIPKIEVHMTNPYQRESFRHTQFIAPAVDSIIAGLGSHGYVMAIRALGIRLNKAYAL